MVGVKRGLGRIRIASTDRNVDGDRLRRGRSRRTPDSGRNRGAEPIQFVIKSMSTSAMVIRLCDTPSISSNHRKCRGRPISSKYHCTASSAISPLSPAMNAATSKVFIQQNASCIPEASNLSANTFSLQDSSFTIENSSCFENSSSTLILPPSQTPEIFQSEVSMGKAMNEDDNVQCDLYLAALDCSASTVDDDKAKSLDSITTLSRLKINNNATNLAKNENSSCNLLDNKVWQIMSKNVYSVADSVKSMSDECAMKCRKKNVEEKNKNFYSEICGNENSCNGNSNSSCSTNRTRKDCINNNYKNSCSSRNSSSNVTSCDGVCISENGNDTLHKSSDNLSWLTLNRHNKKTCRSVIITSRLNVTQGNSVANNSVNTTSAVSATVATVTDANATTRTDLPASAFTVSDTISTVISANVSAISATSATVVTAATASTAITYINSAATGALANSDISTDVSSANATIEIYNATSNSSTTATINSSMVDAAINSSVAATNVDATNYGKTATDTGTAAALSINTICTAALNIIATYTNSVDMPSGIATDATISDLGASAAATTNCSSTEAEFNASVDTEVMAQSSNSEYILSLFKTEGHSMRNLLEPSVEHFDVKPFLLYSYLIQPTSTSEDTQSQKSAYCTNVNYLARQMQPVSTSFDSFAQQETIDQKYVEYSDSRPRGSAGGVLVSFSNVHGAYGKPMYLDSSYNLKQSSSGYKANIGSELTYVSNVEPQAKLATGIENNQNFLNQDAVGTDLQYLLSTSGVQIAKPNQTVISETSQAFNPELLKLVVGPNCEGIEEKKLVQELNFDFDPSSYEINAAQSVYMSPQHLIVTSNQGQLENLRKKRRTWDFSDRPFKCEYPGCVKAFYKKSTLERHTGAGHKTFARAEIYTCPICRAVFGVKGNLRRHKRTYHSDILGEDGLEREHRANFHCSECLLSLVSRRAILEHYTEAHPEILLQETTIKFENLTEFQSWKELMERESCASFIVETGVKTNHHGDTWQRYMCHRSGQPRLRGNGSKAMKAAGTVKIGHYCPAQIRMHEAQDGIVTAEFLSTHVGHDFEPSRIRLSRTEKDIIAGYLLQGVPMSKVIERMAASPNSSRRLSLLRRKDLHNIMASYRRKKSNREGNAAGMSVGDSQIVASSYDNVTSRIANDDSIFNNSVVVNLKQQQQLQWQQQQESSFEDGVIAEQHQWQHQIQPILYDEHAVVMPHLLQYSKSLTLVQQQLSTGIPAELYYQQQLQYGNRSGENTANSNKDAAEFPVFSSLSTATAEQATVSFVSDTSKIRTDKNLLVSPPVSKAATNMSIGQLSMPLTSISTIPAAARMSITAPVTVTAAANPIVLVSAVTASVSATENESVASRLSATTVSVAGKKAAAAESIARGVLAARSSVARGVSVTSVSLTPVSTAVRLSAAKGSVTLPTIRPKPIAGGLSINSMSTVVESSALVSETSKSINPLSIAARVSMTAVADKNVSVPDGNLLVAGRNLSKSGRILIESGKNLSVSGRNEDHSLNEMLDETRDALVGLLPALERCQTVEQLLAVRKKIKEIQPLIGGRNKR